MGLKPMVAHFNLTLNLFAQSSRSEVKRRIRAEEYDNIPDCRGHYDMWYWE